MCCTCAKSTRALRAACSGGGGVATVAAAAVAIPISFMHRLFELAPAHALGQETAVHQRGDAHTAANNHNPRFQSCIHSSHGCQILSPAHSCCDDCEFPLHERASEWDTKC
eukprot:SAG31_NODE_2464_length_5655_cov_2.777898_4_plen_111_part_00